jgi:beta-lactamase class A
MSLSRRTAAALLLTAPLAGRAFAQGAAPKIGLSTLLEGASARLFVGPGGPYLAGIYVKHLGTGEEAAFHAQDAFESASTIKMGVAVMAYQLAEQKKLNLDERYEVKPADYRGGSHIIRLADPGLKPTIRDVITDMIITSNNAATDIMVAKVGGKEKLNAFLKDQGLGGLKLNSTTFEYFRRRYELIDPKYAALTPEEVSALQSNQPAGKITAEVIDDLNRQAEAKNVEPQLKKPENWFGIASAADMGRLLEGIEKATLVSPTASGELKRALLAQQSGTRKMPHFLNVPIGHKTGETYGVTNDVGMIYARSGTIVIAIYSMGYTGLTADADDRLGHVARLVVEYFDGAS